MSYVGTNVKNYKTISKIKKKDKVKFRKTDNIWNQSFQVIAEVRLSRVCGWEKRLLQKYVIKKISAKTNGKVFKSVVRL